MIGFNIADVTAISLGSIEISSIYAGNSVIWEDTPDYEKKYLTTIAKGSGNIGFSIPSGVSTSDLTSISYSTDNGSTWTTTNNVNSQEVNIIVPVNNGDKVLWKGVGITMTSSKSHFTSTVNFDVEGNIMSLLNGDNFYQSTFNTNWAYQFYYLFYNANVVDASNLILPATTLAQSCYESMFSGCTSLGSAPTLPATTLANSCYSRMFYGCTSLTTAPELPATTLVSACYQGMFYGCTSLTTAPELPATTLTGACYSMMFRECTSLTTAPELPATTLTQYCYRQMFFACSHLNYITMLATDISATDCLNSWVYNVAATGTFVKDANATIPTGTSGIPSGWTVENYNKYEHQYFTTVAKGSGNIGFNIPAGVTTSDLTSISYSTDNGSTWTTTNNVDSQAVTVTVPVDNGDKVLWKGVGTAMSYDYKNTKFTSTVSFDVEGNIMSLLNGDNFYQSSFASGSSYNFFNLFGGANVVDASNLILPATTLTQGCYVRMFDGCTSLTTAPELPATILTDSCYQNMFRSCTSLTTAPELPATTLVNDCYQFMFRSCTSLTTAPELPATTLVSGCYQGMFDGCTSLTTAPELPATTLTNSCYTWMFRGCTSLTTAPELPATSLAMYCYQSMFSGCTSLTTAPELPATTLVSGCYMNMFDGCTNLNYIKMMATNLGGEYDNNLMNWVNNVAATGTFVKDANATIPTGANGIPTGWTVQNIGDYEQQYFTTVARESGNIVFNIPSNVTTTYVTSISYSTDNGSTWTTTNNVNSQDVTITVPVNNGDKVLWKGVANAMRDGLYGYTKFTTTIDYDVEGNIMSLLNGDNFYHSSFASGSTSDLYKLFENTNVVDASNLILPATTLKNYCYEDMFNGCTKLTAAPALPATTLVEGCYKSMFHQCGLLTTAPELPATNLANYCYQNMFEYCSNLNYVKMLATNISAYGCLSNWVNDVAATGTFVKNASMTTLPTGASGIPSGWTVQDAA